MALLFGSVVINYLDRANLSIGRAVLAKDLAIDSVRMGLVFSPSAGAMCSVRFRAAGWWTGASAQAIRHSDRALVGGHRAAGFSGSLAMLFALRLAIGAFEAPSFPINNRVVTTWFPESERATAIGFYTSDSLSAWPS